MLKRKGEPFSGPHPARRGKLLGRKGRYDIVGKEEGGKDEEMSFLD